jgi:imidazolonepropionase-like amidohydrolase
VASPHSPLDVTTFTEPELRAAVEAAENWGTYVTVHAYTPASIKRAIAAGVKCIEHGHLMDEATARLIAERGGWLSIQPLPEELANAFPPGSQQRAKAAEVFAGTVMATGTNAELLALSGKRNPYPGKLGVVEVGALADLILVDGNPIEHIKLIADPAKNFVVIMKDGRIYKNLLR